VYKYIYVYIFEGYEDSRGGYSDGYNRIYIYICIHTYIHVYKYIYVYIFEGYEDSRGGYSDGYNRMDQQYPSSQQYGGYPPQGRGSDVFSGIYNVNTYINVYICIYVNICINNTHPLSSMGDTPHKVVARMSYQVYIYIITNMHIYLYICIYIYLYQQYPSSQQYGGYPPQGCGSDVFSGTYISI
jgi:hypothetical protein